MKKYHDWDTTIAAYTMDIKEAEKTTDKEKLGKAYMNRGYARCFALAKGENYERAIEDFSIAIALIAKDRLKAECYVKRAYAYWLNRDFEQAKEDCEQDVIRKTGDKNVKTFAHELLGTICLEYENPEKAIATRRYKKAVEHYGEALLINPLSFSLLEYYREANKRLKNT
jgi:tetratricopeptide (TPR) repeat protein